MNADSRYRLIRKIYTDTARDHDGQHFDAVLDQFKTGSDAYADWGYARQARESDLRGNGYRPPIQRRGSSKRRLSECQKRRHQRIAMAPAQDEHAFAAIAKMGGKSIREIRQEQDDFRMTMKTALLQHQAPNLLENRQYRSVLTPKSGILR